MIITFKNREFHLSQWTPIKQSGFYEFNWKRCDITYTYGIDGSCVIHSGRNNIYSVWFNDSLFEIGQVYLKIFQTRDFHGSVEDAKLHVDKFLTKYLKLTTFI
jgi:hypothetical protein